MKATCANASDVRGMTSLLSKSIACSLTFLSCLNPKKKSNLELSVISCCHHLDVSRGWIVDSTMYKLA